MRLNGNTILITGGSMGIGLEFAREFVRLGNQVIVTGRNRDKLDAAVEEVEGLEAIQCDAADPEALRRMGREVAEKHPATNVLMNNAGVFRTHNVRSATDDLIDLTQEIDINLTGAIRTVSVMIEQLRANHGTIINVTSGLAYVPLQAAPVYCATKAALHSYTISLRQQLAETDVEVVELMPPATRTRLTADLPDDAGFTMMTTDSLVEATLAGLRKGKTEICPGQASQLRMMSRVAPGFIQGQLAKGSKDMVPEARPTEVS